MVSDLPNSIVYLVVFTAPCTTAATSLLDLIPLMLAEYIRSWQINVPSLAYFLIFSN